MIPDSVTSIGDHAFGGCTDLTSVVIGDGVTSIGVEAFYGCSGLTEIVIPESVTSIGDYAFRDCTELTDIFYAGTKSQWANFGLSVESMLTVHCSDGTYTVRYVPADAYANGMSYDTFFANGEMYFEQDGQADMWLAMQDNTVEFAAGAAHDSIALRGWIGFAQPIAQFGYFIDDGDFVFGDFAQYTDNSVLIAGGEHASRFLITVPMADLEPGTYKVGFVAQLEDGSVVLLNAVLTIVISEEIPEETEAPSVGSVGLSYSINEDGTTCTIIDPGTCTDIDIVIPASIDGYTVTAIGAHAFQNCSNLTGIVIPNTVTAINSYAFYYCTGLTEMTIPDSVTIIGSHAFAGCSRLTSITLPFVGEKKDGTGYTNFGYIFGATQFTDNDSYVPSSLTTVTVTGGTFIGAYAFYECYSIQSVSLPDSAAYIGVYAFYNCTSLRDVAIGNGATSIGEYAFGYCYSLTEIVIPVNVTSFGSKAFYNCPALADIYYVGTQSQWYSISKAYQWDLNTNNYTVHYDYVPEE